MKSSCSKLSMASGTPSHILASICPVRSASVSARYGSPLFLGLTCLLATTNDVVMVWFSCCEQCSIKKSFIAERENLWWLVRFYNGWRDMSIHILTEENAIERG